MSWQPARDTFERACNARRGFIQEGEPLSEDELHAIHNLANAGLNPDHISADAARAADALENAIAESADDDSGDDTAQNRDYKRNSNGQFASTGAGIHAQKGGRAGRGNPGAKRNQTNTPLKAARGAKPQAQVDATEHALKATRKKGRVLNVTQPGKKPIHIESGHKDYHGTKHTARHFKPGDTDERKAAKALAIGKTGKPTPRQKRKKKFTSRHKGTISVQADKGKFNRLITSYDKDHPENTEE